MIGDSVEHATAEFGWGYTPAFLNLVRSRGSLVVKSERGAEEEVRDAPGMLAEEAVLGAIASAGMGNL